MKAKGWDVTSAEYNDEKQVHVWCHESPGRPSRTLRISRKVLGDYPAFAVLYHLDSLSVAAAIRARPDARYVVVQNSTRVTHEEALG